MYLPLFLEVLCRSLFCCALLYVFSSFAIIWARRERSGSAVECLTRDRGAAGSSFTGVTALCP